MIKKRVKSKYIVLFIGFICFCLYYFNRTDMSFAIEGKVVFRYGEVNICEKLLDEDFLIVTKMFDKKLLTIDLPSCGFSEDACIQFNDGQQIFCIASDNCPVIYWQNKDRYLGISEDDNILLRNILRKYGLDCPCV